MYPVYFWSGLCGFNATATEVPQPITSPGWPDRYANSLDCVWFITAPTSADRILLELSTFHTEICCDRFEVTVCFVFESMFWHICTVFWAFRKLWCIVCKIKRTIVFHVRAFYLIHSTILCCWISVWEHRIFGWNKQRIRSRFYMLPAAQCRSETILFVLISNKRNCLTCCEMVNALCCWQHPTLVWSTAWEIAIEMRTRDRLNRKKSKYFETCPLENNMVWVFF